MPTVRKNNRLADYDYSRPGAYFITVCTKNRQCMLSTIVGGDAHIAPRIALTPSGSVVERYLRRIPGIGEYVIMPNHVHLILRISANDILQGPMWASAPTDTGVSNLIRSFKTLVSKELGRSIWQRSFYDHIIRDEQDYLVKAEYIATNPARWQEDEYFG